MKPVARHRASLLTAAGVASALLVSTMAARPPKCIFWNASASVPLGLYVAKPVDQLRVGQIVVFYPPEPIARLADRRDYIRRGTPMLKRIAARHGETVCRIGLRVQVGETAVLARATDRMGRSLPIWAGCRRLGADEVFLLNADAPDSFDGRYLGPQSKDRISAIVVPIWTFGRYE
jgi:conjugative transfer signal peptidase TraF